MRISPEARADYLGLVADTVLPDGTTIALFFSDEPRGVHGPVYVMQKASGSWSYLATDERGGIDPRLDAKACARCHDGATADAVFGLPRGSEPTPAGPAAGK